MKLSDHQDQFSYYVACLILFCRSNEVKVTFGEAYRTKDQQLLYRYGAGLKDDVGGLKLTPRPIRSKTLKSKHLQRLAVDLNFFIKGKITYEKEDLQFIGDYWESLDERNEWGGNFNGWSDSPHFQYNA